MKFEQPFSNSERQQYVPSAEDYFDNPILYGLLRKLPKDLVLYHINKIETEELSDEEGIEYLEDILKKREDVTRVSDVSDESLQKHFVGREKEIFSKIENTVFFDTENQIGRGMTAKVKFYLFETSEVEIPIAIKYLVTPTAKTLSAQGEHDLIREVERIQKIEELEKNDQERLKHIRVPHPYFHHKNESIQCYGMELIKGGNLEEIIEGRVSEDILDELKKSLKDVSLQDIFNEVDIFFNNMHELCLHGDIKPANIMVSADGTFYVIDFGQSVLTNDVVDKAREQFETLKEDERKNTKEAIRFAYRKIFSD